MSADHHIAALLTPAIADPAGSAILLDLDGTLAPIVERPEEVAIPATLRVLLQRLPGRYGLVAFISGRELGQLRRIVALEGVAYSGNHGMELLQADGRLLPPPGVDLNPIRAFATSWPPDTLRPHGIWLEDKGATLTLHYRTAIDLGRAREFLETHVAPAGVAAGLRVAPGRMSLEIHPAGGVSKGTAAGALLDAIPSIRHAVSIGDDRTDTDVWRALRERVAEGVLASSVGIAVTSAETPSVVIEEADALVPGIAGVERVLARLCAPHDT